MTKSDKLLYIALTKLALKTLAIILVISSIVWLVQVDKEKTQACIESGHAELFCKTGEGPRY